MLRVLENRAFKPTVCINRFCRPEDEEDLLVDVLDNRVVHQCNKCTRTERLRLRLVA